MNHLDRALAAEEQVENLKARVRDLEERLKGVLGSDPTTAIRALAWMSRAENGEGLIGQILTSARAGEIKSTDLPPGWLARAEAQISALAILKRDQAEMAEAPGDGESWETMQNGQVRIIKLR